MPEIPDFSNPLFFVLLVVAMFTVIMGRFVLIAGLFHFAFFVWFPEKWKQRRLASKQVPRAQLLREVRWSVITSLLFALAGALTVVLWQKGLTRVYTDPGQFGLWYLPVSLIISMLIHETYYYWLHRWMHKPAVFRLIHKVHHDSKTTSPWTAFSFHPLEGLLQAIVLPLTIMFLPMHYYVLLTQLTIMTFSSIINHLEVEVYPAKFEKHFIGKWLIGATHHSLHHKQFKYNFGLYFTFWDKWVRTESPKFSSMFREKTSKKEVAKT
ncbi:sterol desaturase family protein [Segetibacter sp. 3557_3]|uniref:sterol desaturase family protein n=1 Tax=Segetibacter sp. 3557_3 TaxID=2547429 RepID=UPI001FB61029|nr:sterol desaturase family protein [Segetibacter sp. 3557_3]